MILGVTLYVACLAVIVGIDGYLFWKLYRLIRYREEP